MRRLLVAGSRQLDRPGGEELVHGWIDTFTSRHGMPDVVVTGAARGADTWGMTWAVAHDIPTVEFYPNWDELGKRAGHLRNKQMAATVEWAIVIRYMGSPGSANMLNHLRSEWGKPIMIHEVIVNEDGSSREVTK